MPSTHSLSDPKAYHILSYGTLLGATVFQTFFGGPLAYKALPRAQFSTLQTAIFPPFFTLQTVLPAVLALTFPGDRIAGTAIRSNSGFFGLLADANTWSALAPIAVMFGTSIVNLLYFGPATTKVMKQRKHQETRDGRKYNELPKSPEMQKLNSSFGRLHGISSLSNVVALAAMIFYGFALAEKL
ncbi:Hypothetical protein R9X50_00121700 [Acrodontium crateriforme]|uniref:TMEM205-like domain-containing protein n=1 Tax=Acrodontium crateriforme TaxID=150365 RepID=A0AAQ3LZC7_9PEZI|nr:Hypothetical protein R9X50_00121700 [Acrodontium crateriforme]